MQERLYRVAGGYAYQLIPDEMREPIKQVADKMLEELIQDV